jgi:predicted ATP-dependent endonuclease of OLD family
MHEIINKDEIEIERTPRALLDWTGLKIDSIAEEALRLHLDLAKQLIEEVSSKAASSLTKILTQISSEIENQTQPLLDQAYVDANKLLNVIPDPTDPTREQDQRIVAITGIEGRVTRYLQRSPQLFFSETVMLVEGEANRHIVFLVLSYY